jgi:carbonic anhydrase
MRSFNVAEIETLLEGFQRFRARLFEPNREFFNELARKGQSPKTMVIGCSDSRVDPAIITDAAPGDLFVVRNVANLVPPCETKGTYHGTSAALEFAVCNLSIANIIVLGHAQCGGIKALLEGYGERDEGEGFIAPWVKMAGPARERVLARWPEASKEFQQRACERASILVSLENLMSFPFVKKRMDEGRLKLFGWYFDIDNGELMQYDPERRRFHDLYFNWD